MKSSYFASIEVVARAGGVARNSTKRAFSSGSRWNAPFAKCLEQVFVGD